MPSALTYPGVYVEELSSGVRTIVGVPTSIAAFLGRARYGPVNEAVTVTSYADFERTFGGLWRESPMTYVVRDFFLNGGAQAVVVRLLGAVKQGGSADDGKATLTVGGLPLRAKSPGSWGSNLVAYVDKEGISGKLADDLAKRFGVSPDKLFNLTILELAAPVPTADQANFDLTRAKVL